MRRALYLAPEGRGDVEPNPMVGAVVARGSTILAEGFHASYGGAHAEAAALSAAGEIAALPPTTVAVTRGLMRGHVDAVLKQIEAESSHFRDLLQSDEARAAFAAFLARKK